MKNLLRKLSNIGLVILVVIVALEVSNRGGKISIMPVAQAQGGFSGVGTYEVQVMKQASGFSAPFATPTSGSVNGTGGAGVGGTIFAIQNYGQSAHWLMYCWHSGTGSSADPVLEGSNDTVSWVQISEENPLTTAGCRLQEAAGYFNYIRVRLLAFNSAGSTGLDAWYSATQTAIPGNGLFKSGKSSQPVTFVPDITFANNNLKSAGVTISSSAIAISAINISNNGGANVFVTINGTTGGNAEYMVPSLGIRDISLPQTMQAAASSTVNCATSVAGTGDPAVGCVVTISYKTYTSMTTQANAAGATSASTTVIPN
jgi:hypothetical protein